MRFWDLSIGSFVLYARLFPKLVLLATLTVLPPFAAIMTVFLTEHAVSGAVMDTILIVSAIYFYGAVFYFLAATTLAVSYYVERRTVSLRQMLRMLTLRLVSSLLAVGIIQAVILSLPVLALVTLIDTDPTALGLEVVKYGAIAVVAFCLVAAIASLIFAAQISVLERVGPFRAIRQSLSLAKGLKIRVVRALLLFYVTSALLTLSLIQMYAPFSAAVNLLFLFVLLPVSLLFSVLVYYDARARKGQLAPPPEPLR